MTTGTHWQSVDQCQEGAPGAYLPRIWEKGRAGGRGFGWVERKSNNRLATTGCEEKWKIDKIKEKKYGFLYSLWWAWWKIWLKHIYNFILLFRHKLLQCSKIFYNITNIIYKVATAMNKWLTHSYKSQQNYQDPSFILAWGNNPQSLLHSRGAGRAPAHLSEEQISWSRGSSW